MSLRDRRRLYIMNNGRSLQTGNTKLTIISASEQGSLKLLLCLRELRINRLVEAE